MCLQISGILAKRRVNFDPIECGADILNEYSGSLQISDALTIL